MTQQQRNPKLIKKWALGNNRKPTWIPRKPLINQYVLKTASLNVCGVSGSQIPKLGNIL